MRQEIPVLELGVELGRAMTGDPTWGYGVEGTSSAPQDVPLAMVWAGIAAGVAVQQGAQTVVWYGTIDEQDDNDPEIQRIYDLWVPELVLMNLPGYLGYVQWEVTEIEGRTFLFFGMGDSMQAALIDMMEFVK